MSTRKAPATRHVRRPATLAGQADRAARRGQGRQRGRRRLAPHRRHRTRPRQGQRNPCGDRPRPQGRQAGLCRTDLGRHRRLSRRLGLRLSLHARLRHADAARSPHGSDLLQGPSGQAGPEIRRLADGQVQGLRRTDEPRPA